jgi:hypothetical protein
MVSRKWQPKVAAIRETNNLTTLNLTMLFERSIDKSSYHWKNIEKHKKRKTHGKWQEKVESS